MTLAVLDDLGRNRHHRAFLQRRPVDDRARRRGGGRDRARHAQPLRRDPHRGLHAGRRAALAERAQIRRTRHARRCRHQRSAYRRGTRAIRERSPLRTLEHSLHPWVAYAILPVFAFANAGVRLAGLSIADLLEPIPLGIVLGLVVGKQLGVFVFAAAAIRLGLARLPEGVDLRQIYGAALLCGIGFTMSLFIGSLAFEGLASEAGVSDRLGILLGSMIAAVAGCLVLQSVLPRADDDCCRVSSVVVRSRRRRLPARAHSSIVRGADIFASRHAYPKDLLPFLSRELRHRGRHRRRPRRGGARRRVRSALRRLHLHEGTRAPGAGEPSRAPAELAAKIAGRSRSSPISSSDALDEIAGRLAAIRDRHGPRAIATYCGTYGFMNSAALPVALGFHQGLGQPELLHEHHDRPAGEGLSRQPRRHLARRAPALLAVPMCR